MTKSRAKRSASSPKHLVNKTQQTANSEDKGDEVATVDLSLDYPKQIQGNTHCKPNDTPWWKTCLDLGAFCLGIVAVVVYKGQWHEAAEANKMNAENFIAGQRPWLGPQIGDEEIPIRLSPNGGIDHWAIHYKNFGNSPALQAKWKSQLNFISSKPDWNLVQDDMDKLTLDQPNMYTVFNGDIAPNSGAGEKPAPAQLIQNALNGQAILILIGKITYTDNFHSPTHTTEFCIRYMPPAQTDNGKESWASCPTKDIAN